MPEQVYSRFEVLDQFDATTGWAALGNDTLNLVTSTKHLTGSAALTFDKVNGAANTVFAGIAKTLDTLSLGAVRPRDVIRVTFYVSALTDIAYAFVRLGTDSSNYNEWRIDDSDMQVGWNSKDVYVGDANYAGITGNGWNPASLKYAAVGIAFDAETNTLSGIIFDHLEWAASLRSDIVVDTEVTVSGSSVDIEQVAGTAVAAGAGAVTAGTLRTTLASDDPAVASLSGLDDWDESDRAKTNPIVGQAGVAAGSGVVGATTQRVVLATDVGLPAGTSNIGDVDVLSIAAGDNNIGNVDIVTVPTDPFGATADAASASGSISAKLRFIAATGIPITDVVPGFAATSLGKREDDAHASLDVGVMGLAIEDFSYAGAYAGTAGDYTPVRATNGMLLVRPSRRNSSLQENSTVAVAGTRQALTDDQNIVTFLYVSSPPSNTGYLYVGNSSVSSSAYMFILQPGQTTPNLVPYGAGQIYVDASVSGTAYAVGRQ